MTVIDYPSMEINQMTELSVHESQLKELNSNIWKFKLKSTLMQDERWNHCDEGFQRWSLKGVIIEFEKLSVSDCHSSFCQYVTVSLSIVVVPLKLKNYNWVAIQLLTFFSAFYAHNWWTRKWKKKKKKKTNTQKP